MRGVAMLPGATELTRMWCGANSTAMLRTRLIKPALAAPYEAWLGADCTPSTEEMQTMLPGAPRRDD